MFEYVFISVDVDFGCVCDVLCVMIDDVCLLMVVIYNIC